jgi:hypothetical protein
MKLWSFALKRNVEQEYLYDIKTGKQSRSFGQFIKIE